MLVKGLPKISQFKELLLNGDILTKYSIFITLTTILILYLIYM